MRLRNRLKAYRGELVLGALWCLRTLCSSAGLRVLYCALLVRLVRKTSLFDEGYYLVKNPDIAESHMSALFHYVAYGDREGRSPMTLFDPVCYRDSVIGWTKKVNALLHFTYVGRYCRTTPSPWFDVEYYLKNNKDVARANINPLVHYLEWGGTEGRSPCPHFDSAYYLKKYPDVSETCINPLLHYLEYGQFEGRRTVPSYNAGYPDSYNEEKMPSPVDLGEVMWQSITRHEASEEPEVDVIVPVYKGKTETLLCIYSVLSATCNTSFELIVINDASPDEDLITQLRELSSRGLFRLIENRKNKGFVYTVNRGIQQHAGRDIVLLNSDTEVYSGWLDRLKDAAYSGNRNGTVTPLSNNATICSYPYFLHDNPYPLELDYSELDAMISEVNKGVTVEAPTGVGFCIFIRRSCIDEIGLLDEKTFGKGYGEENDFCQRAIKNGWRNLIAADVFVRHWGSVSFQGEKAKLTSHALKLVERRHPNYLSDIAEFIKREPLAEIFQSMDMARLLRLRREKNVLVISHARGGGTEKRVQEDVEQFTAAGYGVFLMRPVSGAPSRVALSHQEARWLPNLVPVEWSDLGALRKVVDGLHITEVISHSFVDFIKEAPTYLKKLVEMADLKWVMNLHDYEVVCPRINLVDEDGFYCKEPGVDGCNRCLRQSGASFAITDISEWRASHETAMRAASRVVVPDQEVKDRLYRYFPDVTVEVTPHEQMNNNAMNNAVRLRHDEKLRVVVVGAISKIKGFDVLRRCARDAKNRGLPLKFILLGYSLNDRSLEEAGVEVTGKYKETEAIERLNELSPHLVWLPSIWPETYSYTLSIGLKGGYPVMAFDIGAIARRLRESRSDAIILPLGMARYEIEINNVLSSLMTSLLIQNESDEQITNEFAVAAAGYE